MNPVTYLAGVMNADLASYPHPEHLKPIAVTPSPSMVRLYTTRSFFPHTGQEALSLGAPSPHQANPREGPRLIRVGSVEEAASRSCPSVSAAAPQG